MKNDPKKLISEMMNYLDRSQAEENLPQYELFCRGKEYLSKKEPREIKDTVNSTTTIVLDFKDRIKVLFGYRIISRISQEMHLEEVHGDSYIHPKVRTSEVSFHHPWSKYFRRKNKILSQTDGEQA